MITSIRKVWILLAIGLAFTFNPNIAIIDPLPDVIGYALISFALGKHSMINQTLDEAKRAFERMILIDGGKILAIIWIFGIEVLSERNTSMLVWCFAFAVLEGIFLIPAYIKLFKGISELGDFHQNSTIHAKRGLERLSFTEKIRNCAIAFVCFKAFMNVLPELSVLSESSTNEVTYSSSLYRYIGVIRGFCFIPVLIFGIVWLVSQIKYFKRISKDEEFNSSLDGAYQNKAINQKGLFIKSYVNTACWFMLAGAVLTLDFRIEKVNIIPDIFVVALFIPAFIYFSKISLLKKRAVKIYMILYAVASVISYVLEAYYIDNYTYNAMNKNVNAFTLYFIGVMAVAIQGIIFICLLATIFKELRTVISDHTGYVQGKEIHSQGEEERIAEVHKELNKNFLLAIDVAMIYVLSDVLYSLYGAFYAFLNVNLGFLNVVNLLCGALFIGVVVKATREMKEAVDIKYMLE